ncbi:MAG: heme-binding protein [Bacteroidetes bacterium]|nr:heme-binding protein [Bacteroidota bacterium]
MNQLLIVFSILVTTGVIAQLRVIKSTSETNTITYEILSKMDKYEIRSYPDLTVATTELERSSYSEMARTGFSRIASYIFGKNSSGKKISMTSPVKMDMSDSSSMSFYLPPEYLISELPVPDRSDVRIQVEPAKKVAVIQFSGWASKKVLESKFEELKTLLEEEQLKYEDSYSYLGYNPPYQLINRRNEVIVKLINQ